MEKKHFPFLSQTRNTFREIRGIFQESKIIAKIPWEKIDEKLLSAGISSQTSRWIIGRLQQHIKEGKVDSASQAYITLRQELTDLLRKPSKLHYAEHAPTVMLIVGPVGSGKTTTSAKLAFRLKQEGRKILLITTNSPRTSGIDPLQTWAKKINVPIIGPNGTSDPSIIVSSALQLALIQRYELMIIDTPGYLVTEKNN